MVSVLGGSLNKDLGDVSTTTLPDLQRFGNRFGDQNPIPKWSSQKPCAYWCEPSPKRCFVGFSVIPSSKYRKYCWVLSPSSWCLSNYRPVQTQIQQPHNDVKTWIARETTPKPLTHGSDLKRPSSIISFLSKIPNIFPIASIVKADFELTSDFG